MTIRDIQGRLFQPGFIADIPTGNLLWVDPINGNNDLAVRGRMTVPFKTLAKARDAAAFGDTIMVLPGNYNENNLAKNGVNWHFFNGAVVEYNGTGAAIFDTSGGACSFKVAGSGRFKTSNTAGVRAISLANTGDVVTLEFDTIEGSSHGIYSAATLVASGNEIRAKNAAVLEFRGGSSSESIVTVQRIIGDASANGIYCVGATGAVLRIKAQVIRVPSGYGLIFDSGTVFVDALELSTTGGTVAISYNCSSSQPLYLNVRRVFTLLNSTYSRALQINAGSGTGSGAIRLYGCSMWAKYGSFAVSSSSASDVICVQQCVLKAVSGGSASSNVTARIHTVLDVTANTNVGDL